MFKRVRPSSSEAIFATATVSPASEITLTTYLPGWFALIAARVAPAGM
jgi:hypothetical protein